MADLEREHALGFVDKRRTQASTASPLATPGEYLSVDQLRTRLAAIDGAYFTAARLNNMTKNDMVYAVRLADDAAGV